MLVTGSKSFWPCDECGRDRVKRVSIQLEHDVPKIPKILYLCDPCAQTLVQEIARLWSQEIGVVASDTH